MKQTSQALFEEWQIALKADDIPRRISEVHDQTKITHAANNVLSALGNSLKQVHGRRMPSVNVQALPLWDFSALVGKDRRGKYCLAVGIGAVRLLDVLSACLCVLLFDQRNEAQEWVQRTIGSVLYDYARHKFHRLRHWMIDPTFGLVIPYGILNTQIASAVPQGAEPVHRFYLWVMLGWILAHEVAHIAARDIEEVRNVVAMSMSAQLISLTVEMPRPGTELNADRQALRTLFEEHPGDLPRVFTALTYFLAVLQIIERISTEPVFAGPHHPAPGNRLQSLIESLPEVLPQKTRSDIEQLRAIGLDFQKFSDGIAIWILETPEHFRYTPVVLEDFQEHPQGLDLVEQAARSNNAGDVKYADGDLVGALELYTQAAGLLSDADYAEAQRIVWSNLIRTTAGLSDHSSSLQWLLDGVRLAKENYDKPTVIALLRAYQTALEDARAPAGLIDELQKVLGPADDDLVAVLSSFQAQPNI